MRCVKPPRQTHESRNYVDGEEEPKHVAGWCCLVLFWGRVWHWWPEAHRRPAVASKPSSEFYHRGLRALFAEDWCCRGNHTNRKERQSFGKWYCEMLDRAITNRGTNLKLKLCGCWMCFSWFPGRITVRNDLCQKGEWEKTKPCSYLFSKQYTVQRWTASLLISSPHYFRTNIVPVVSPKYNTRPLASHMFVQYVDVCFLWTFLCITNHISVRCSILFLKPCLHQTAFEISSENIQTCVQRKHFLLHL